MKNKIIKIGLIGCGRWGPNLIGSIRRIDGIEINHVADQNKFALENVSKRFTNLVTHENALKVIESPDLDAVLISTPVETHLSLVELALKAKKHVFVEKPFGQSTSICESLCSLAEKNNLLQS